MFQDLVLDALHLGRVIEKVKGDVDCLGLEGIVEFGNILAHERDRHVRVVREKGEDHIRKIRVLIALYVADG